MFRRRCLPKAERFPVSGKVTVVGKALSDCTVIFSNENPVPGAAGGYSGEIGADGAYTLSDSDGNPGSAVGKHKITFTQSPEAAMMKEEASRDLKALSRRNSRLLNLRQKKSK